MRIPGPTRAGAPCVGVAEASGSSGAVILAADSIHRLAIFALRQIVRV